MPEVRIDCYLGVLKKFKKEFPNAYFEYVNNRNILAPSRELKIEAGVEKKKDGTKNPKMLFDEYSIKYIEEINNNPKALKRLKELSIILRFTDIFLICYEVNPLECHRSIIKKILDKDN